MQANINLAQLLAKKSNLSLFYSLNITGTQTRYTATEKELLSIVETLK